MLIALRIHLFDAIRVIATCMLSFEQDGDSVLKLSISLNPQAHDLAFVDHFSSTNFCLRTQHTDCGLAIVLSFVKDFF